MMTQADPVEWPETDEELLRQESNLCEMPGSLRELRHVPKGRLRRILALAEAGIAARRTVAGAAPVAWHKARELAAKLRKDDPPLTLDEATDEVVALYATPGPARAETAGGWRPIESAPKDGTDIDLYGGGRRWTGCMWRPRNGGWCHDDGEGWREISAKPTHWMPLPPAPGATPAGTEATWQAEVAKLLTDLREVVLSCEHCTDPADLLARIDRQRAALRAQPAPIAPEPEADVSAALLKLLHAFEIPLYGHSAQSSIWLWMWKEFRLKPEDIAAARKAAARVRAKGGQG